MSEHVDIAVIGSGAAGIAAAVSAARAGGTTLLLDKNNSPGGTGGFSGLTTLCGLFDDAGNYLNNGFAREFSETLLHEDGMTQPVKMGKLFVQLYRPGSFQKVAVRFLAAEKILIQRWNTPLQNVVVRENRIQSLNGVNVGAVIDCSGTAEAGRAAGERVLATDVTTQAPSVIFSLAKVAGDLNSPLTVAKIFSALAYAGWPPVSFMPGCDAGITSLKFSGPPAAVPGLVKFLQDQVPGFERCRCLQTHFHIAERGSVMIVGGHLLTGAEVLGARKFPDAVVRNQWPVEQWSGAGEQRLRQLPPGEYYEIPARSLQAAHTENLFMAGKSLSADVDAVASARVMGCALATGAAAGKLAAQWLTFSGNQ